MGKKIVMDSAVSSNIHLVCNTNKQCVYFGRFWLTHRDLDKNHLNPNLGV
jgi:hypothetical protein